MSLLNVNASLPSQLLVYFLLPTLLLFYSIPMCLGAYLKLCQPGSKALFGAVFPSSTFKGTAQEATWQEVKCPKASVSCGSCAEPSRLSSKALTTAVSPKPIRTTPSRTSPKALQARMTPLDAANNLGVESAQKGRLTGDGLLFNNRIRFTPKRVLQPKTLEELRRIVVAHSPASRVQDGMKPDVVTVISGGHHYEGWSASGQTVIDVSMMKAIRFQSVSGKSLLTVEAGVLMREMWRFLDDNAEGRLFIPSTDCESVSVIGAALCGGLNPFQRSIGLICDHVESFTLVKPDGEVVRVDAQTEPELWWALRGAGSGHFGVVAAATFRVSVRPAEIWGISLRWADDEALAVIQKWGELIPTLDRRMLLQLDLQKGGAIQASGIFTGPKAELEALVSSWGLPSEAELELREHTMTTLWEQFTHNDDAPSRWANTGLLLSRAPSRSLSEELLGLVRQAPKRATVAVALVPGGGAIRDVPINGTAFRWRDYACSMQAIARWTGAEEDAAVLEWVGRVRSLMGVGASDGRAADAHAPADDSHHAHDAHDARQADAHAGQAHGSHVAPLALQPSRASDAARAVHRGIAAGGAIAAHGVRLYAGWAIGTLPLDEALNLTYGEHLPQLISLKARMDADQMFQWPQSIPPSQ
uniref:FAD-binding PCMH-type domain-containing protein n=1 Tax=Chrysotila carterae TaxID=13221 RepID=A0A7S4B6W5_CHRCT